MKQIICENGKYKRVGLVAFAPMSLQLCLFGASQSVSLPKIGIMRSLARCSKLTKFALVPAASNTLCRSCHRSLLFSGRNWWRCNRAVVCKNRLNADFQVLRLFFAPGERHVCKVHFLSCFKLPLCRRVLGDGATHHLADASVLHMNNTAPSSRRWRLNVRATCPMSTSSSSPWSCDSGTQGKAAIHSQQRSQRRNSVYVPTFLRRGGRCCL